MYMLIFFWTEITEHKVGIKLTQHISFHWKCRETWTEQNSFHNNTFHPIQDTDLKVPFDDTDIQVANTHTHICPSLPHTGKHNTNEETYKSHKN